MQVKTNNNQEQAVQEPQNVDMGNAQLATAVQELTRQMADLQRIVLAKSVPCPPTYGNKPNQSLGKWIFKMEQYFLATKMSDERKVPFASTLLRGYAFFWWRSTYEWYRENGCSRWSWDDFKEAMRKGYNKESVPLYSNYSFLDLKKRSSSL